MGCACSITTHARTYSHTHEDIQRASSNVEAPWRLRNTGAERPRQPCAHQSCALCKCVGSRIDNSCT
eukprot:13816856-Alexandrium_andersonii.AAC.1